MKIHIRNIILAATCLLPFAARAQERPLTVCEGKTWNYCIENSGYGHIERIDDLGYHFDGTREADGHTYGVFRDGSGKEAALMRQEGGKVYRNLEPYLREHFNGDEEAVLYDFGLKPGEEYISLGFVDNTLGLSSPVKLTVLSVDTIEVHGQKRIRQRIESELWNDKHTFTVVEGIGPDYGRLDAPQWGCRNTGFYTSIYHTVNVTDSDGNTVFTERDFGTRDYKPMLVEGRTWEYMFVREYNQRYIHREVLRGTTERFGNTYHVLMNPETNDTIALMREDGGKVYMLMGRKGEIINLDTLSEERTLFDESMETVVYDFSLQEKDRLTHCNYILEYDDGCFAYQYTVELDKMSMYSEGGEQRIRQRLRLLTADEQSSAYPGRFYEAIEGIGIVYGGNLPYYCPFGELVGKPRTSINELVRVYDTDGKILYGKKFPECEPLVREDRTWEYASHGCAGETTLSQARFQGITEINGKEYHNLKITEETTWDDRQGIKPATTTPNRTVALMREENGRVYVCVKEKDDGYMKWYEGVDDKEHSEGASELLLYDFNAEKNDTFLSGGYEMPCHTNDSKLRPVFWRDCTFFIQDSDSVEIQGKRTKRTVYSQSREYDEIDKVIEGIGPERWTLWNPVVDIMTCAPSYNEYLNGVYDGEGRPIFGDFSLKKPGEGGIDVIDPDTARLVYAEGVVRAEGEGRMTLEVFSADGAKIGQAEGYGSITVSASGLVPGIYIATLKVGGRQAANLRFPAG